MHPLQNGSQVQNMPPLKPLVGTAGYFSESNEQGAPSYPGQDYFNKQIAEFLNALAAAGIEYDHERLDHLARAFAAVRSQEWNALVNYGVGEQVLFSGKRYYAVQASGPDNGGEQQPDPSIVEYWFEIPSVGTRAFEFLSVPVGAEIAFDTPPPTDDPRFRFVKLTYNDAYNTGLLTSQTLSGSAPELVSTAVISAVKSPINGQTIHLKNTMEIYAVPTETQGIIAQNIPRTAGYRINTISSGVSLQTGPNVSGFIITSASQETQVSGGLKPRSFGEILYKRIY